jgi:hypothetical protein
MVTPVNGIASANTLLSFGNVNPGYCLHYVWQAYKANGASSSGSYATAYDAWLGSPGKVPDDWNPPAGYPVYFGPRSNSAAGDVVISLGGGMCAATDWPYNGVVGTCSLTQRQQQIGRPYLGWTDNILGYPIMGGNMLTNDDKQLIKDCMFEFFRDVNGFPAGMSSWPFFDVAVWQSPVPDQDMEGRYITRPDGSLQTFEARGFLASTNTTVHALAEALDVDEDDGGPGHGGGRD